MSYVRTCSDSTAWYSGISTLVLVILAGMAVWACCASLGNRAGRVQERLSILSPWGSGGR